MSEKTEANPLSLAEQALAGLPAHTNDKAKYQGQWGYWVQGEAKFVPCSNPGTAIAYYRQRLTAGDIAVDHNLGTACVGRIKLYAEHQAFRQQVATELASLLSPYADTLDIDPAESLALTLAEWKHYNATVYALATRLGIDLSPAS